MQALRTIISSKFINKGIRTCEACNAQVPIIEVEGQEYSHCLNCDNKKLETEMSQFKEEVDKEQCSRLFEKYSIIPSSLKKAQFDTYIPKSETQHRALTTTQWYAENFEQILKGYEWNSLLLKGSYGVGKSHLSHAVAQELKRKGYNVIFIDTPSLLQMIRDGYRGKEKVESDIFKKLANVDLLVLDDIGAEYVKSEDGKESWGSEIIFRITSSRTDKPNIFTTNYGSKELKEKYGLHGGRIVSRMSEKTKKVEIEGEDYRVRGWK